MSEVQRQIDDLKKMFSKVLEKLECISEIKANIEANAERFRSGADRFNDHEGRLRAIEAWVSQKSGKNEWFWKTAIVISPIFAVLAGKL